MLVARHGGEAIALLEAGHVPDLLVVDLQMPVCDGAQVVRHLRSSAAHAQLPVLILTGDLTVPDEVVAQTQGVLLKPFDLDELASRVRALLPARAAGPV